MAEKFLLINAIESCAISVAISVVTDSVRPPIVSLSVGVLNLAAQQSVDCLISYRKRKIRFESLKSTLIIFYLFFRFHKDCHESPACSTAPAGSQPLHICEYVTTTIL